jgi:hypothetical protein
MELALTLLKATEFPEYLSFDHLQLLITVYLAVMVFKDGCRVGGHMI